MIKLLQIHPTFSTTIYDEDSDHPFFARLASVNINQVVRVVARQTPIDASSGSDNELDALLSSEHNISFPVGQRNLPLWRLVITFHSSDLSAFTASLLFHHSLADGVSALVFVKDFHSALNSVLPGEEPSHTYIPTRIAFPPSLEFIHTGTPISRNRSKPSGRLWLGISARIPAPIKTSSNFRSFALSATTTSEFLHICKAHGTTVGATLPVIIACAVTQSTDPDTDEFECTIAVNLRKYLDGIQDVSVGVYYDGFSSYIPCHSAQEFNWESVSRVQQSIHTHMQGISEGRIGVLNSFSKIPSMIKMFEKRIEGERTSSFDVSNIGGLMNKGKEVKEEVDLGWKMGRCVFSRSAFVSGSAFTTGVVTGGDGCMNFGFAWQEGVVEGSVMDSIILGTRRVVDEVVRRG
jgi:hypothetical protein